MKKKTTRKSNSPKKKSPGRSAGSRRKITDSDIVEFLSAMSKKDLVSIIMQVCRSDTEFRQIYTDRIMLEAGDHAAIIRETRNELRSVTDEESSYNSWDETDSQPDYSRLQSQLRLLIDSEQFDAVIELGRELIERGMQQVQQAYDDGETAHQLMSTISIVAEAIMPSSLTHCDRILFVIDSLLQDDYGLCDSLSSVLDRRFPRSAWSDVAKELQSRLPSQPVNSQGQANVAYIDSYRRKGLSNWIINALDAAGDKEAATEFCIEEATKAGSYQRAVDRLMDLKRYDKARQLALQGLDNVDPRHVGTINGLQDSLATIAAKSKDHHVAATIAAARFVKLPSVASFGKLMLAAKKAKCEQATQAVAMRFLETGKQPSFAKSTGKRSTKKKAAKPPTDRWPFPAPPGVKQSDTRLDRGHATKPSPHFGVLIGLSIQQRDSESVLRWYDQWLASTSRNRFQLDRFQIDVADAVSSTHPDRAVELYCAEADRLAAETNTQLYPQSVALLKKARKVLKSQKREDEFEVIMTAFHDRHRRKRRLVELLGSLKGQSIVSKRRSR